jgi:hypothetical protein
MELPEDRLASSVLAGLRRTAESYGVAIVDDPTTTDSARYIGQLEGHTVTLFPRAAGAFAQWFTLAHLYGHMVQMAAGSPRVDRANALVRSLGVELSQGDVQLVYDHEREAAEIGRALIAAAEPALEPAIDLAYTRFFHADFRYLVNVIETAQSGPELFARYWKREPMPRALIAPDARPLVDLRLARVSNEVVIVVLTDAWSLRPCRATSSQRFTSRSITLIAFC